MGASFHPAERVIHQLSRSGNTSTGDLVLRGLHTAIVDEGDNILIDEAVTPLVISRTYANAPFRECCLLARELALSLMEGRDFLKDAARKDIRLTPRGEQRIQSQLHRFPSIWKSYDRRNELVTTALVAEHFFIENTHFAINEEKKIEIIDEFTGRILPGRTWKQGLHQAVEAKCGLEITDPAETMASMSFQRFFRLFTRLSALSGTAKESADELWHIYRLPTVRIPTHRPTQRVTYPPTCVAAKEEKFDAIVEEALRLSEEGRAVLIGTRTLEDSEVLAVRCRDRGCSPALLNAVRHKEEAAIVAQAGCAGAVTIATNMAGRGTDIPVPEEVLDRGGLHVMMTEVNASGRIDRQLVGRTGRQGNPGSSRTYYCLEDELFQRYVPRSRQKRIAASVKARLPGSTRLLVSAFRYARSVSERAGVKQRRTVLRLDTWLDEQLSFTRPETRI
jgi:preprotein translocase subunit SecA